MEQKKLRLSLKADRKRVKEQAKLKMLQLKILQEKMWSDDIEGDEQQDGGKWTRH